MPEEKINERVEIFNNLKNILDVNRYFGSKKASG
jgi:hypothetical protein